MTEPIPQEVKAGNGDAVMCKQNEDGTVTPCINFEVAALSAEQLDIQLRKVIKDARMLARFALSVQLNRGYVPELYRHVANLYLDPEEDPLSAEEMRRFTGG